MTEASRYDDTLPCPSLWWRGKPVDVHALDDVLLQARRCAVGQGALTRFRPDVRDAWELSGDELQVDMPDGLAPLLARAGAFLGLGGPLTARLDKLVLYGPDGHFAPHRDTLRGDGHVATLVVRLRSAEQGGRLWVGEHRPVADPSSRLGDGVPCTVFHTDVPHRIEPVDEGWRVALVYQVHRSTPPQPPEADEAADTCHATGHTVDQGEVALLAHRYSEAALRAGALVGIDRALIARWRQENPAVRIVLGALEGRLEQEYASNLSLRVRPLHPKPEGDTLLVRPTVGLVGALEFHLAAGGYSMWTGNEGTQVVRRYRAGAAVRWPGKPAAERHPEVSACLEVVEDFVPRLLEVLDGNLPALKGLADELRQGAWREPLLQQLDPTADPAAGVAAIQETIDAWMSVLGRLHVAYPQEVLRLQETPDDAFCQAAPAALAEHAAQQGFTRLTGAAVAAAPDALLRGADEIVVDSWAGRDTKRLQGARVRRLTVSNTARGTSSIVLPPLAQLQELTVHPALRTDVDLDQLPQLRRLTAHARVTSTGTFGNQAGKAEPSTLVHADLVVENVVPAAVCVPSLRVLRVRPATHDVLQLSPLRHATGLRRLVLDGVRAIHDLPWGALASGLTHLHIVRRTTATPPLHLPRAAQRVLDGLEELVLDGVCLGEVQLGRCTRLHTLHLAHCTEAHGLLPAAPLRSLRVVNTAMPLPELPLLEELHVEGPGRSFTLPASAPRLRQLHLAHLHCADLGALGATTDLRHLTLHGVDQLHLPTELSLPSLESLTLQRLPVGELPIHGPNLRVLHVDDLPIEALPEHVLPELSAVELRELPLTRLPSAWQHSPLQRLVLDELPLPALPAWLASVRTLEVLRACHGRLVRLPSLASLTKLRKLVVVDQPELVVDAAFAANVRSAPSLVWLELNWAGEHSERTPDIESQLRAGGYEPPPAARRSANVATDADDDIPF